MYSLLGDGVETMTITLWSDSDCAVTLYATGRSNISLPVLTAELSEGYNELVLSVDGLNWSTLGTLNALYLQIGGSGDNVARVIRLSEIEIM